MGESATANKSYRVDERNSERELAEVKFFLINVIRIVKFVSRLNKCCAKRISYRLRRRITL